MNSVGQFWYVLGKKLKFTSPSMILSRGCGSSDALFCMFFIATSLAVSVAAQKNGGDSLQPIWSASEITNRVGSLGLSFGNT